MQKTIKKYFIPHAENEYRPHILHPKRAAFYSVVLVGMKAIAVMFVALLPAEVFLLPEVLSEQAVQIRKLTNELRGQKGRAPLKVALRLNVSAQAKADDMAVGEYFNHVAPDRRGLADFLSQAGYKYRVAGENLAMGFTDAQAVVNAWIKSPTHYANLIDSDYRELGVGLESGYYQGLPTVYVAQHFGQPAPAPHPPAGGRGGKPQTPNPKSQTNRAKREPLKVRGEKIIAEALSAAALPHLDQTKSFVAWQDDGRQTTLTVQAVVLGTARSAAAQVSNYPIELVSTDGRVFRGSLTISESSDNLFRTVILPTVLLVAEDGTSLQDTIPWKEVKIVSKTPWQKYLQAKKILAPLTRLFSVSRSVYLGAFIFFVLALLINIFVEIRKQHYHIIAQTLLLLFLIAGLYWI